MFSELVQWFKSGMNKPFLWKQKEWLMIGSNYKPVSEGSQSSGFLDVKPWQSDVFSWFVIRVSAVVFWSSP